MADLKSSSSSIVITCGSGTLSPSLALLFSTAEGEISVDSLAWDSPDGGGGWILDSPMFIATTPLSAGGISVSTAGAGRAGGGV